MLWKRASELVQRILYGFVGWLASWHRRRGGEIYWGSSCVHAVLHVFVKASVLASPALARTRRPGAARLLMLHGRRFVSACRWGRCAKGQSWRCDGVVSCAALGELTACSENARGPPRRVERRKAVLSVANAFAIAWTTVCGMRARGRGRRSDVPNVFRAAERFPRRLA